MRKLTASRGSAITLTSALRDFKSNPTKANLAKSMNRHGLSARQAGNIMACLKAMGHVTNHGKYGNKCHFTSEFRTSQVMSKLHEMGAL